MSNQKTLLPTILSILSLCCSAVCLVLLLTGVGAQKLPAEEDKSVQYVMYVGTNDKDTYQQGGGAGHCGSRVPQVL